jgi:hypothetical protein
VRGGGVPLSVWVRVHLFQSIAIDGEEGEKSVRIPLMKKSPLQSLPTHSGCSGSNFRLETPGLHDGCTSVSLSLLRASFLEQPLVGGGEWWSGVHLKRRRRRGSTAGAV